MSKPFVPAFQWPGPLHPDARRVEIDEFLVDNAMTNLFLVALREMQDAKLHSADDPKEDWFSYYNLASVHGYPLELWRGVPNKAAEGDPANGYYCTHGSTVFPTWHRCEIVMFEQAVYRRMSAVAHRYHDKTERDYFLAALKRFRFPYWDPIMPRNQPDESRPDERARVASMFGLPRIFSQEKVFVKLPEGGDRSIKNPLYSFSLPSQKEFQDTKRVQIPWARFVDKEGKPELPDSIGTATIRTPNPDGTSNHAYLNEKIQMQANSLATTMWQLLNPGEGGAKDEGEVWDNDNRPWDVFANHFKDRSVGENDDNWQGGSVSLESWHDDIHLLVGAGEQALGYMAKTEIAAFDPMFFFHHTNVERLLAIYQALYGHSENKFVPTEAVPPNIFNRKSELSPFEAKPGVCYSSDDVKDWTSIRYGMPGIKELDNNGKLLLALYIHETYFWATTLQRPPKSLTYPKDLSTVYALNGGTFKFEPAKPVSFVALDASGVVNKAFPQDSSAPSQKPVDLTMRDETHDYNLFPPGSFVAREEGVPGGTMRTWNALINIRKYALGGSFLIQIFLGKRQVPDESEASNFFSAPNQVGFSAVFASGDMMDCENCQKNAALIYEDSVPLTTELPKYLRSNTANPDRWPPANLRVLENLEPESIVPFLTTNLEWRVVTPTGQVKTPEEVTAAGLKLAVAERFFDFPSDRKPLGSYSANIVHPEITQGKVGGFSP